MGWKGKESKREGRERKGEGKRKERGEEGRGRMILGVMLQGGLSD